MKGNVRKLIYPFSLIAFSPAAMQLFGAGAILTIPATLNSLLKGQFDTLLFLGLLLGGGGGLLSAFLVTFDIGGNPVIPAHEWYKRAGLIVGLVSELAVIYIVSQNKEPFMYYWLPGIPLKRPQLWSQC